ncbi:MAG: PQQ-binding-like beta-propeller repeat protein, partial [Planctomycetia bacterium]|nr:PQQ-binding-like beta-propeller repeat protein [Planctomycetia bacterium]
KEYMKKGGKVRVTDCAPAVNIPGAIKVELTMTSGMVRHNQRWDSTKEFLRPEQAFIAYKDELLKKLRSATTPFVVSESMWITFSVQKYGKAKYVFAVNDRWPPLYNDKRKFRENQWVGNPYGSFYPGRVRMQFTMPAKHTLYFKNSDGKLPEGYVVYDMFDQKQVELKDAAPSARGWKAGKRTLDIHFVNNPARILVCLPKAIDKVSVAVSPSVKRGELLRSKIRVLDADGKPIDALFPVEIKITDPDGRLRYHVWRTGGPDEEKMYKVALNDTPGKWTFWAKELVSGAISENTFTVEVEAVAKLRVTSIKDKVILLDKYPVWEFLRKNQVEGPILIVLGTAQKRLVPLAEKLKAGLEKVGNKAEVRFFDRLKAPYSDSNIAPTISVRNGEFRWCQGVIPGQGVAGIPPLVMRNVIVLATPRRAEYQWKEIATGKIRKAEFAENDAGDLWYLQGKTPNYPAPGWALIQYQWGTYVLTYDVVHVYANDDKGLERGVDKLIRLAQIPQMTRDPTLRRTFNTQEGPVVGGEILAKRMKPTPNAPTTDGQKHSRRRENFLIPGRMGVPIRGWAISRNGKYFAVGTDGYGENLFMFSRAGKLMWKKKVGVLNVRFLNFSKDSRKLQCSSNVEGTDNTNFIVENTCVFDTRSGRRLKFLFGKQDPLGVEQKEVKKEVAAAKPVGYKKQGAKLTRIVGGKEAWSFTNEKGQQVINVDISPNAKWVVLSAWSGGQPWISGNPILVLLNGKTGRKIWEQPTDGVTPGHNTVKVTDGGAVILQDGSPQGQMFNILRAKDGKNVYSYLGLPGSGDQAPFQIGPGGKTILLDFGGMRPEFRLKHLHRKTPAKVIKFDQEIQSRATTPDGKRLLLGTWDGFVSLLDKKTWETLWRTETYGGPYATFTPDHKNVFVTTYVGWVYLLDAKTGEVVWKKDLNEAEAVPNLYAKVAKWLDDNTTEALKAGHTINVDRHPKRNEKGLLKMKLMYRP